MPDEIVFETLAEEPAAEGEVVSAGFCGTACGPACSTGCGHGGGVTSGVGCGVGCGGCSPCNATAGPMGLECGGDGYGPCSGHPTMPPYWAIPHGCGWFFRDFSMHFGVHGFEGPADFGRNGNFGFHGGFNHGGALAGPWGYQFGLNVVMSNYLGDTVFGDREGDRDQVFFTGGIFRRRPCGGWQWGAAVDLLHDSYYETINMTQVRSETSYVFPGGIREIGYFGMYSTGGDRIARVNDLQIDFEPTDLFAFFYRRHFSGGGNGRFWAGFTGNGDGLFGGDLHVPLGTGRWSLVNRFNYLIPKEGTTDGGISEESWGVTIQLVWYPSQPARTAERSRFKPLFDPADNTLFMVDRHILP